MLCRRCRYAVVVQGGERELIECEVLSSTHNLIRFNVEKCTHYRDNRVPTVSAMEDIAWILRSDPVKKIVGFVHARDLAAKERHFGHDD